MNFEIPSVEELEAKYKKPEVPERIKAVIEKWKEDYLEEPVQPDSVILSSHDEYDPFGKHLNTLVSFKPGIPSDGLHLHNMNVWCSYRRKLKLFQEGPNYTAETYIVLDREELMRIKSIDTVCTYRESQHLIDSQYSEYIDMFKTISRDLKEYITPLLYNPLFVMANPDIVDNMHFMHFHNKVPEDIDVQIDVIIKYNDGTERIINDEIYELKYAIMH